MATTALREQRNMVREIERTGNKAFNRLNRAKRAVLIAFMPFMIQSALATNPAVATAFAEAENYARQQKSFSPGQEKLEDKKCRENIKDLEKITHRLNPSQLVELIALSKKRMSEEFRYPEPYLRYFEQLVAFSIDRLAEIPTEEASQCLDKVRQIVGRYAWLSVVRDEAKARQQKLMRSQQH